MEKLHNLGARSTIIGGAFAGLMTAMVLLGGGSANAASDDPVGDAFSDLSSKVATYGAAVVGLVVAGVVILFGIKWLKRGASKA